MTAIELRTRLARYPNDSVVYADPRGVIICSLKEGGENGVISIPQQESSSESEAPSRPGDDGRDGGL